MSLPTEFTVRPVASLSRPEKPIFGVYTPGDTDKGTAEDVAKAANPLHYVPFVSQVYEAATGETGSAAMKLIGGALLGGPIGFIAGLVGTIFEQESGKTIVASIAAAITGEDAPVQVANAEKASVIEPSAGLRSVETPTQEILPPVGQQLSAADAQDAALKARQNMASLTAGIGNADSDVLDLFGGQPNSAHQSYRKAQMLPYLKDVNVSHVI